ncbi:hypothetical protein CBER1_05131 [Cercospora berteroae]|uniref:Uncharacterized protein n=1 Tax=Cercospora berteroae TaxID=357750 RepID=A0A2S6C3G0_9PEZI|nr:hypothetical protein CBER1_05131 [Cercospora berteroae]
MRNEALEILYKRHELQFYTTPSASLLAQDNTRKQICKIEEYEEVLRWVHKLRIVLFVPQEPRDERILLALMAYVKAVLAEREVPLERFTLEMCAFGGSSCKPSAVLYAAQGFRTIENVKFEFQSGFSGAGSESAKELLVQQTAQKTEEKSTDVDMSKEKALYGLEQAWSKAQPAWYNPRLISNCWLGTNLEV